MWIFTSKGFVSLAQHPDDPDMLLVQMQSREDMNRIVEALDEIGGRKHELLPALEQGCCIATVARGDDVAKMVSRLVTGINYSRFTQSAHFDFGADPNFIMWVSGNGLQLARVKPDVR